MWQQIKNLFSYIRYAFAMDLKLLASIVFDIIAIIWSIIHIKTIVNGPNLFLICIAVIISIVFQIISIINHFGFLRFYTHTGFLKSMLENNKGKMEFSKITVDRQLITMKRPYSIDTNLGALKNDEIDSILLDNNTKIIPELDLVSESEKANRTKKYILHYKDTLLQFLNQKWYEVNPRCGIFTNDKKICLSNEIIENGEHYKWTINEGCYYNGYLTNFIFSKFIEGSNYPIYAPKNLSNYNITTLGQSDFSDHIGVSTLIYTSDGYLVIFKQSVNSAYNPNKYVPSGSGSLDYSDYNKNDHDIRDIIIRGANRELLEETSLEKKKQKIHIKTKVICYYRDMERGGKPEFCCISQIYYERIKLGKERLTKFISPNEQELSDGLIEYVKFDDENKWKTKILPIASLSLKMNFEALKKNYRVLETWLKT